jgi:hypothetical protein
MRQAHRGSTVARPPLGRTPRRAGRGTRAAVAAIALALLVGVAAAASALAWPMIGAARNTAAMMAAPAPAAAREHGAGVDPADASDYGTEFDPFVIQGSGRWRAPAAPTRDDNSDVRTECAPVVSSNPRPRYTER